jgi:hypothetical protein
MNLNNSSTKTQIPNVLTDGNGRAGNHHVLWVAK